MDETTAHFPGKTENLSYEHVQVSKQREGGEIKLTNEQSKPILIFSWFALWLDVQHSLRTFFMILSSG